MMFQSRFGVRPDFFIVSDNLLVAAIRELEKDGLLFQGAASPSGDIEMGGFRLEVASKMNRIW